MLYPAPPNNTTNNNYNTFTQKATKHGSTDILFSAETKYNTLQLLKQAVIFGPLSTSRLLAKITGHLVAMQRFDQAYKNKTYGGIKIAYFFQLCS